MSPKRLEKSLERFVDQVDNLYQKSFEELTPLPEPDQYGQVRINYQDLRKLIQNRRNLGFCQGVYRSMVYIPKLPDQSFSS